MIPYTGTDDEVIENDIKLVYNDGQWYINGEPIPSDDFHDPEWIDQNFGGL